MNVITLTGNAVKDVEIRFTPNGKGVANGTIAVRRDFKNQNGEYETDFINFVALGGLSEVISNHVKKGDKFGITGRLQIRKWEKDDGSTQYVSEVVVNGFDFPTKQKSEGQQPPTRRNEPPKVNDDPFATEINPDDLPF